MITFTEDGEKLVCVFSGRLDTVNCMDWEKPIHEKIQTLGLPVVFDLESVDYVASIFLRMCIRAAQEAGEGRFSVANVCPAVKKVFKVARLDILMVIE